MDQTEKLDYGPQNCSLKGQWGKWKGKTCIAEGCEKPAKSKGYCMHHYNKKKWADGYRPPSVNKRSRFAAKIKYRYGVTIEEFDKMVEKQDGKCAICNKLPGDNVRAHWGGKLCIDHDHETEKVRALLCNDCNLALGYAKNEKTALAMAEYFRLHS